MTTIYAYSDVSSAQFDCVKTTSAKAHGTVYTPPEGNAGTAFTKGTFYSVLMGFVFAPETNTLTYTLEKETGLATPGEAWGGIEGTLKGCGWSGTITPIN
jgi:hypothetical protein